MYRTQVGRVYVAYRWSFRCWLGFHNWEPRPELRIPREGSRLFKYGVQELEVFDDLACCTRCGEDFASENRSFAEVCELASKIPNHLTISELLEGLESGKVQPKLRMSIRL